MKKPWLIQRCTVKKDSKGAAGKVSEMLDLDYMGSTEFECGSVPESIRRLAEKVKKADLFEVTPKGEKQIKLYLICDKSEFEQYSIYLQEMLDRKIQLKEWTYLPELVNPSKWFGSTEIKTNFWWDIENDIFWTTDSIAVVDFGFAVHNSVRFMNEKRMSKEKV